MDDNTLELLFNMLTNEQLLKLRKNGAMDARTMYAFKVEMFKRCLIEMDELLEAMYDWEAWKKTKEA